MSTVVLEGIRRGKVLMGTHRHVIDASVSWSKEQRAPAVLDGGIEQEEVNWTGATFAL